jgi:hypothetical protein
VLREVVQRDEQAESDAWQRLDEACGRLTRLDADLVEWTFLPADASGKRIIAELVITEAQRPLEQLARLLNRIARDVRRLAAERA